MTTYVSLLNTAEFLFIFIIAGLRLGRLCHARARAPIEVRRPEANFLQALLQVALQVLLLEPAALVSLVVPKQGVLKHEKIGFVWV